MKVIRLRIVRPLLNEEGEIRLKKLKQESKNGHIPSNHYFWKEVKKEFPDVVTWEELGYLLTQIQKKMCFIYNKASAKIYSELSDIDFKLKEKGLDSMLSKFGYPEAMKEFHDSYFALGLRQKLKSNFSGRRLTELRRATISVPVARSDNFPIPITMQNGFNIEEIKDENNDEDYGDFIITVPFPKFKPKNKMDKETKEKLKALKDKVKKTKNWNEKEEIYKQISYIEDKYLNKYKPWEKFEFEETTKKKHISLLLSTKERRKIDRLTKRKIKKLEKELRKEEDKLKKKRIIEKITNLREKIDFGTQAEIRRLVKGEYKITWIEINKGKRLGQKNKWFVHITIETPIRKNELDKRVIGGIDIGCNSPVYCAVNNSFKRLNIQGHDIIFFNNKERARRRILLKRNRFKRAGHGSKNKLKPIMQLTEKNELFRKKIMERWTKEVVAFFKKNRAGVVQMEDLESLKNREDTFFNQHLRVSWPYARLQNMIENKLKEQGIEVKKIKSKYTSQICSACGEWNNYFNFEYRKENKFPLFECKKCNIKLSPDYNAARNISNPNIEKEIEKIEKLINK